MKKFHAAVEKFCGGVSYISMVALLFAMFVLVIDIILHLCTKNIRILGNREMVELSMVVMMFLYMAVTQFQKGHVRVDMFVNKFGPRGSNIVFGIVEGVTTVLCAMLCFKSFSQTGTYIQSALGTSVLHIPFWPFMIIMGIGFALFTLALLITTIEFFMKAAHPDAPEETA